MFNIIFITKSRGYSVFKRKMRKKLVQAIDKLGQPITFVAVLWLKSIRRLGIKNMQRSLQLFRHVGIYPLTNHFYEPLFDPVQLHRPLDEDRQLPGIDFNVQEQLEILRGFNYQAELLNIPLNAVGSNHEFCFHNNSFESGDAEYLYSIVRHFRPQRIIEVGSGNSTLLVRMAIAANVKADEAYRCEHTCIEPFSAPWLEELSIPVIRERVELVDQEIFQALESGDILFIDSSHVIRPQGDVVTLFLEVLPMLKAGVLVHIHDIFLPKDYPQKWIVEEARFWNEQYLLEALLTGGSSFRVLGALNFLRHHHWEELGKALPVLAQEMNWREPGSFWIIKQ